MQKIAPVFLVFRALVGLLAVVYFSLAVAILGLRYVVLPNIGNYLPEIEQVASRALGVPVRIGALQASWYRLHPQFTLINAQILGPDGDVALALPRVDARLSWRSVLTARPQLLRLRLHQPTLAVSRDHAGVIRVAGFPVVRLAGHAPGPPAPGANTSPGVAPADPAWGVADHPLARWLLAQPDTRVLGAVVQWHDATGALPDLDLANVSLQLQARRLAPSRFVLDVTGEFAGGRHLQIVAQWQRAWVNSLAPRDFRAWQGQVYVAIDQLDLNWVRPWLGHRAPAVLQGLAAGRAWLNFSRGAWAGWQADLAVRNLQWASADGQPALALQAGHWRANQQAGELTLRTTLGPGLVYLPDVFADPVLPLHRFRGQWQGSLEHGAGAGWQFQDVSLDAGEPGRRAELELAGRWWASPASPWGNLDLQGQIVSGDAGAVARLMPRLADDDVRAWLKSGLRAGQIAQASVVLNGPLHGFPYADADAALGQFRIDGQITDVAIDLVPDAEPGWPLLSGLQARLVIDRDHLWADITRGEIRVGAASPLQISEARLDITGMNSQAQLTVAARASGAASTLQAYLAQSPLAADTAAFQALEIDGELEIPLQVQLVLDEAATAAVQGALLLSGNRVSAPGVSAAIDDVQGRVDFTESLVQVPELRGRWLGGAWRLNARFSDRGEGQAQFQGSATATALQALLPDWRTDWLGGVVPIAGEWRRRESGDTELTARSSLKGTVLSLPAPLRKPADSDWPLQVEWRKPAKAASSTLQLHLPQRLGLVLAWPDGAGRPERLAVAAPGPARLPERGWQVEVALPTFNLDAWRSVLMSEAALPAGQRAAVVPPSSVLSSDAPLALPWAELGLPLRVGVTTPLLRAFDADWRDVKTSLEITASDVVRLQVQSPAVSGRAGWRPPSVAGPARLEVDLDTLHLPRREAGLQTPGRAVVPEPPATDEVPAVGSQLTDPARWPYVDLAVERLVWGKRELGRLTLGASPMPQASGWQIDRLVLTQGQTTVQGQGNWRVLADAPRSEWQLEASSANVGALLADWGMADVVEGGQGALQGRAAWPGAPWEFALERLEAELDLDLQEGRFLPVSSTAGRLLGILSLQSLVRAVTFQGQNVFTSGFAWDTLRSQARVAKGELDLRSFEMRGQSAAAFITGQVHLLHETQSLKVLVLPQIDASAAAVLAGLAINPIVGVGAFLTQWLMRGPLSQVLSLEYAVTGSWAEPEVQRVRSEATSVNEVIVP